MYRAAYRGEEMIQELVEQIENTIKDVMNSGLHTSMPAKIVSIDEKKGLVDLQPLGSYYVNGVELEYPIVPAVPLVLNAGKECACVSPIKKGDTVMMTCAEQSVSSWLTDTSNDQMDERFELQNAMAVPGLQKGAVEAQREANKDDAIVVKNSNAKVKIWKDKIEVTSGCKIVIEEDSVTIRGNLHVNGDITCTGSFPGGGNGS